MSVNKNKKRSKEDTNSQNIRDTLMTLFMNGPLLDFLTINVIEIPLLFQFYHEKL